MSDPMATLSTLRLADSFLPVGAYTASYGLEQLVADDQVTDADELEAALETYLRQQVGPSDVVVLANAHRAATEGDVDGVVAADRRLTAVTMAREFRESSTKAGGRLLELQGDLDGGETLAAFRERVDAGESPGNYVAALGVVAAESGIDAEDIALAHCHAFVTGLLGAAQRLLSLGHTRAQEILLALQSVAAEVVSANLGRSLDAIEAFAPGIDLASMRHERAERRLFMS